VLAKQNFPAGNTATFDTSGTTPYAFGFDVVPATTSAMNVNIDAAGLADYQTMIDDSWAVLCVGTATFRAPLMRRRRSPGGQVVTNLVENALRYGAQDRPVVVGVHGERDAAELTVHNEGASIPKDEITSLFDPFRRGRRATPLDLGLGLGLYIVDQIVRAHGGGVLVSSTDRGTEFSTSWPRRSV
jgi:light-regulated signal transduction histidine kinase (bacteriophytochrome)